MSAISPALRWIRRWGKSAPRRIGSVVDLPGIYSIRPYTNEEIVTRDFILNEKPDGIINIVDATNIERNLYLTLQLLEMHIPMVLALNMMDEVRGNGGSIDYRQMSQELGIPVIPISAAKDEGIEDLIAAIVEVAGKKIPPKVMDFCEQGPVHRCIHAVSHQVEDHAVNIGMSPRFAATKIVENDTDIIERLALSENELEMMEHSIAEMEKDCGLDRNAALADMRYTFIEKVCQKTVKKCQESRGAHPECENRRCAHEQVPCDPDVSTDHVFNFLADVPCGRRGVKRLAGGGNRRVYCRL